MEIGRLRGCLCRRWEQQDGPEFPFTRGCLQGRRWASQEGAALLGLALVPWDMGWGWAWGSRVLAKPRQFVPHAPCFCRPPHTANPTESTFWIIWCRGPYPRAISEKGRPSCGEASQLSDHSPLCGCSPVLPSCPLTPPCPDSWGKASSLGSCSVVPAFPTVPFSLGPEAGLHCEIR